jgi:hypothetical protein
MYVPIPGDTGIAVSAESRAVDYSYTDRYLKKSKHKSPQPRKQSTGYNRRNTEGQSVVKNCDRK